MKHLLKGFAGFVALNAIMLFFVLYYNRLTTGVWYALVNSNTGETIVELGCLFGLITRITISILSADEIV